MEYNGLFNFTVYYLCLAYSPDIICLQEVEFNLFARELSPLLKKYQNMHGMFLKKGGRKNEGLSCFYSHDRLKYVTHFI